MCDVDIPAYSDDTPGEEGVMGKLLTMAMGIRFGIRCIRL